MRALGDDSSANVYPVALDQSLFRAGVTQILFESFANLHPNFAKILPRDSLHGPETKAISFWVRNHWSSGTQISRNFLI